MTTRHNPQPQQANVPATSERGGQERQRQSSASSQGGVFVQRRARDATAPMVPSEHHVLRFNR